MKKILKYIGKYKLLVFLPFIFLFVSIVLDLMQPFLSKVIVDRVLLNKETSLLGIILVSLATITLVRVILGYFREYTLDYLGVRVATDIKNDLFDHIQTLSFKYFDNMNTGELMSRLTEDVDNIWMALAFGISLFIENSIYFIFAAAILLYLNWKLALISLCIMPILAWLAMKLEKDIEKAFDKISDHAVHINTTAQEDISGIRLVKAFAREKHEILKFLNLNAVNYNLNVEKAKIWGKYYPLIEFLTNISIVLVISFGGMLVIKEDISIGTLVAFNGYLSMLVWPMRMMGWLTNVISQANTSAKKIFGIMNTKADIASTQDCIKPLEIKGDITFKNVSFKYNNSYVLKNINLNIKAGSTVAIMGTTGSGKTSLVSLIGRYYDVTEGSVEIDGKDIRDLDLDLLRSSMSVVFQDTFLFSDSIANNVAFSVKKSSEQSIKDACNMACIDDFISSLENGYDTEIGERGIGLSGGQKQRLSIARAMIKKSSILILDDSTSALDMETEFQLLKNLNSFKNKPTTFLIAHRISAVKNADIILYLEDGSIKEYGTHNSLLAMKGRYYQVYSDQFKDYEELEYTEELA